MKYYIFDFTNSSDDKGIIYINDLVVGWLLYYLFICIKYEDGYSD